MTANSVPEANNVEESVSLMFVNGVHETRPRDPALRMAAE
jgi:hypothetical protein